MFHPWRRLRAQPEIDVVWERMPDRLGSTDRDSHDELLDAIYDGRPK